MASHTIYWGCLSQSATHVFKTWEDFGESIRFWFTPDLFSAFNGEYWEDWIGELKLGIWVACCFGCVYGEAFLIEKIIG